MLRCDIVAQESSCFRTRVGHQGLFLGQFQVEDTAKKLSKLLLDYQRFCFRPNKAKQKVVRIPYIPESPEIQVIGLFRGKSMQLFQELFYFPPIALPSFRTNLIAKLVIRPRWLALFSSCIRRLQFGLYILIQLIQVHIRKGGADDPALRCSTHGFAINPVFHVAYLEHMSNQSKEAVIVNGLS